MITGIHHINIRCESPEEEANTRKFYGDVLGLPVKREWAGGIFYDTGAGQIEVFLNRENIKAPGAVQHIALACDDVDSMIEKVRSAGLTVTAEPRGAAMPTEPPLRMKVAFCIGPVGETIEFFQQKD